MTTPAWSQPTVAPSSERVGPLRGQSWGDYNILNSFETGYRFHSVSGNLDRYRSDVNFGNGIRLLGSSLDIHSKDGRGGWFDQITLGTQGLGNDPYQAVNLRIHRNSFYQYDFTWRINDYVNPGLAGGEGASHPLSTRRQWQDHDFTLFPDSTFRILAGYSRNSQDGAGLSSIQLFDGRGDEFPLFQSIDRRQSEFRLGADAQWRGMRLLIQRGWQRFREQNAESLDGLTPGRNTTDNSTLTRFRRTEPYEGDSPYWRIHLTGPANKVFGVQARLSHSDSTRSFRLDELSTGTDRLAIERSRQIAVGGAGRRPVTSAGLTLSLFPSTKATLTNHTAFHQIIMDGDAAYSERNSTNQSSELLRFQYLGIRTISNASDASWRPRTWLGLFGGYHYSSRRIRSHEGEAFTNSTADVFRAEQTNALHAGLAGLRLRPVKRLTIQVDSEIGRASQPFFPVSSRRYHVLTGRIQYRTPTLQLSAASKANYNTNSANLFAHSSRARNYSADLSWAPKRTVGFDAGYSKLHLDTLTGLAYFASFDLIESDRSVYVSNLHSLYAHIRFSPSSRLDITAGFTRIQDTGDGRSSPGNPASSTPAGSSLNVFRQAQVFPLTYQSPLIRASIRIHQRLRWNTGYQFYDYTDRFSAAPSYSAHTGFTSMVFSF